MQITVFGGSGFLGSHVCDKLSDAGHRVIIFDRTVSPWLRDGQEMITGDILDQEEVLKATEESEIVFNFAGIADIGDANINAIETVKYNILGNAIILEACVTNNVKRYIYASSVYVYSRTGGFYSCSKQSSEAFIEKYQEIYGLEYTILRYGSLYGPRSNQKNAICRFVKEALETGKIYYFGNPRSLREYIHVEDAARCSVKILQPQYANEIIILTGHQPMRVGDLLEMIAEMLDKSVEFIFEEDPNHIHYTITPYSFSPKIGKKFHPPLHVDLGQGILRVIEDIHRKLHPDLQDVNGVLVNEKIKNEKK